MPVALSAVALRDEAGAFIGRSCTFEDLSVLHQLRGRLAAQEQLLAHVTREAADAILGVGRDGRVTGFNRAAEGLLGLGVGEALGRPLAAVAGDVDATALLARVEREKVVRGVRAAWRRAWWSRTTRASSTSSPRTSTAWGTVSAARAAPPAR